MADIVPIPCMGCGKTLNCPRGVVRMAEREGNKYVAFCSRSCNLRFVQKKGQEGQDASVVKLFNRVRDREEQNGVNDRRNSPGE